MTLMDIHVGYKNNKCVQNSNEKLLGKLKNKFTRLTLWHQMFYLYIYVLYILYIQNAQHDAQNTKCHINIYALMQPPFKFQSSADHNGHLIPVPK